MEVFFIKINRFLCSLLYCFIILKFNVVYILFINLIGILYDLGVVLNWKYIGLLVLFEKLKMIFGDINLEKKNKVLINGE